MRDVRALLASIGTGALVIAAAAFSLLTVTFVFAAGGLSGTASAGSQQALVLAQERAGSTGGRDAAPTAIPVGAPAPRASRFAPAARRQGRASSGAPAKTSSAVSSAKADELGSGSPTGDTGSTPAAPPAPGAPKPNVGDSVKKLGDNLSSTVQQTGSNLAKATAPLGPPVSATVQQVLNVVAAILQQTTNLLGTVLGAQPGR